MKSVASILALALALALAFAGPAFAGDVTAARPKPIARRLAECGTLRPIRAQRRRCNELFSLSPGASASVGAPVPLQSLGHFPR